jgi:GNAT superfamily N-acetyltransferase
MHPMDFELKTFHGAQGKPFIREIADLRIRVFREYPYLYDGSHEYEREYLGRYFQSPDSTVFLLFNGPELIGASTCIPLADEAPHIRQPFLDKGLNVSEYFYFGESILDKSFRGKGFGKQFFRVREQQAMANNRIKFACFCAVMRPYDHPLKPVGYKSLEGFWQKIDYQKASGLFATMTWKEIHHEVETKKNLQFWIKNLR